MKRYIEANALYASIAKDTYILTDESKHRDYGMHLIGIKKKIDDAPTADVVEVVRCKDCDFCIQKDVAMLGDFGHFFCVWNGRMVSAIGYCYCGERRE